MRQFSGLDHEGVGLVPKRRERPEHGIPFAFIECKVGVQHTFHSELEVLPVRHACIVIFSIAVGIYPCFSQAKASDLWNGQAFSADSASLRSSGDAIKAAEHDDVTVLLNDVRFNFDEAGRQVKTRHLIYRIEDEEGVKNWAETNGRWEAWHQEKPEIRARVLTPDGSEHWLDPKTLNDLAVHQDAPDVYTDERKYGGPLPALTPGAIVEEEVVTRDKAPFFAAGTTDQVGFGWYVAVNKTHFVLSHPDSLPLQYRLHLLPDAVVTKSEDRGIETITIDQGALPSYADEPSNAPPDAILAPEIEFSTGASWQQVASEYARLSEERLRVSDVKPLLASIDLKTGGRNQVVRRVVAVLHKNVRYTGVEFAESSLIPQFPSETLKRKYGDCKDKASLLVAMLRGAGIPAYLALLNAGPGQDVNTELPGLGMFDHAIVYVPASGSDAELWIDATAQYSQVGTLPWMDYGRWALVANDTTRELRRIPEITSAENIHRETREFALAEYGPAKITETNEEIGPEEADYREFYSGNPKEVRNNSEEYVKDAYLADSLTSLEHGDLSDLDKPAAIKFVTTGKRGNTDLTSAAMAIRVEALFNRLPKYFRTKEDDQANQGSDKPKARTADWWITPFTTEWHYKITAPPGFRLRALPANQDEKIGVLSFTQEYSANREGTSVNAVLRLKSESERLSAQQGQDLRTAVLKATSSDPIYITFESVGHSLLVAGKIKDGLAAYRELSAEHPREALHKVQLAQALLTAGLGEEARSVATEATKLEPSSSLAFSTLAEILKHDLIGRALKKGMDFDGAVAAYKKAIVLDPRDKESRANLALLLEYDTDGTRYNDPVKLKEAVEQLRELKTVDENYSHEYDDNVLYDLWYAHDPQGVLDYASDLPATDVRKGLVIAAVTLKDGIDAGLKKSLAMSTDEQGRSKDLVNAGAVLLRIRKYPEAAALLTEGARGQENESQVARTAAILSETKPYQEIAINENDPRGVVQRLFGEMLSGRLTFEEFKMLNNDPSSESAQEEKEDFDRMMSQLKLELGAAGLPLTVVADMAVSNMRYTIEGDDSVGYKITLESPGAAAQDVYIIKDGGRYKVAGFSGTGPSVMEQLAPLALRDIEQENLAGARKWLDRAREHISASGGDDPLAGQPFPYFWAEGQDADVATARTAALVLLSSKELKGRYFAELTAAQAGAKTAIGRGRITMVLAYAREAQEQWAEMLPLTQELLKNFPDSVRAFELAVSAYTGLKQFDDWERLVQARMEQHPDELAYVRSLATLAEYRGEFRKSREILKSLIDKSKATPSDLNQYSWEALMLPHGVDQAALDAAQRASELTNNSSFPILHTLACLDAQEGKIGQARELLLKAMDSVHMEQPNPEIWFGFASIAEQYGILDAAQKMYQRIEKPKREYPSSTYVIAQQRLAALRSQESTAAKTVGQ